MKMITVVDEQIELLPHFLKHYSDLGVKTFIIAQHNVKNPDALFEQLKIVTQGYSVILDDRCSGKNSFLDGSQFANVLRAKYVADDEWSFVADLDEFHSYPIPVPQLIQEMDVAGAEYYSGTMYDRLTKDGKFPQKLEDNIHRQFPMAALVTKMIVRGGYVKMMLLKGKMETHLGHHGPRSDRKIKCYHPSNGIVYHFKWWGSVLERIQRQRAARCVTEGWSQYVGEHDRLLTHCMANDGGINLRLSGLHVHKVL